MRKSLTPDLTVNIAGLRMKNPVMTASGTFGYGREYQPFFDLNHLGALVTKGISLKPMAGNPPPRICETTGGLLNAIGLENVGVEAFIRDKLPFLSGLEIPVIVNILGHSLKEYPEVARHLNGQPGIAALEINISCPNVARGGLAFGADPRLAAKVVSRVRKATTLSFNYQVDPPGDRYRPDRPGGGGGRIRRPFPDQYHPRHGRGYPYPKSRLGRISGGLSGPAIKPVALRLVYQAVQAVKIPVIGLGGIRTAEDALEFLLVGARAVQIGTANFIRPTAALEIIEGLKKHLIAKKISKVTEVIGILYSMISS